MLVSGVSKVIQLYKCVCVCVCVCVCEHTFLHAKSLQLCGTLCNTMDYSPPGSSVHGILQARILEWIPMPSSSVCVCVCVCVCVFCFNFSDSFLLQVTTKYQVQFPVVCSRSLLLTYFIIFKLSCQTSCFTILCQFLLHNKMNHLCVYICPIPLKPPSPPGYLFYIVYFILYYIV